MTSNVLLSPFNNAFMSENQQRKIYLTDQERTLTFAGIVELFEELKGKVSVTLLDVQVYEYSTSIPLYDLPEISFTRPKNAIYTEEF